MKSHRNFYDIALRYFIILLASLNGLWIFYLIFTPLTVFPTYFILNFFFDAVLIGNTILINNEIPIELIKSCIAGSAYYLLLILNLSIPKVKIEKRIKMTVFAFSLLLIFNIFRIVALSFVFLEELPFFVTAHWFFWYFMSIAFVILIWFFQVWIFKIKEIPFYSDFKFLHKHSIFKLKGHYA